MFKNFNSKIWKTAGFPNNLLMFYMLHGLVVCMDKMMIFGMGGFIQHIIYSIGSVEYARNFFYGNGK